MNLDPVHWPGQNGPIEECLAAGFTSLRYPLVLTQGEAIYRDFEGACASLGMDTLPVLVSDSFTGSEWGFNRFGERVQRWQSALLRSSGKKWELGNEPETDGGGASSKMGAERFGLLLSQGADALPGEFLISGGLVDGQPPWILQLREIMKRMKGFGNHLYEMSPDGSNRVETPFGDRLLSNWCGPAADVCEALGLDAYITEIGWGRQFFRHENDRAADHRDGLAVLASQPFIAGVWGFSYGDMVQDYDMHDGGPLLSWDACSAFAKAQAGVAVEPPAIGVTMPNLETLAKAQGVGDTGIWTPPDGKTIEKVPGTTIRTAWLNTPDGSDVLIVEKNGYATLVLGQQRPKA